jgi:hypothetical protein
MTLPRVDVPTYELTLPSQDLKVKFRPFSGEGRKNTFHSTRNRRQQTNC